MIDYDPLILQGFCPVPAFLPKTPSVMALLVDPWP
ncbi:hypothetical protein E3A20_29950, partial [Planctomyces bekefii]